MLIRISLIVAIIAGLAVGGLNFVKVKEKITTLQANLKRANRWPHQGTRANLASTKKDLNKTTAELKQTKADAGSDHGGQGKGGGGPGRPNQARRQADRRFEQDPPERDAAQADLAAYKATGVTPQQILGLNKEHQEAPGQPGRGGNREQDSGAEAQED